MSCASRPARKAMSAPVVLSASHGAKCVTVTSTVPVTVTVTMTVTASVPVTVAGTIT
jgi:hypothetical protein